MKARWVTSIAIALCGFAAGCVETVPIFNAIDSTGTVDAVLIGGDDHIDFRMPRVRGDVVTADYTMEVERRAWFFQQDLYGTGGVTGGEVLLMPLPAASLDQTIVDIAPFDSSKWLSARIYDQGECSVLAEWTVANPVFGLPDMVTVISSAVDSAFISSPNVVGGRRTVTMAITPVFRSRRIIDGASVTDSIRVTSAYFADRIMEAGGGSGAVNCANVSATLAFELRIQRLDQAQISVAPQCQDPSMPGGTLFIPADPAFDFAAFPVGPVDVQLSGDCVFTDAFTNAFRGAIVGGLAGALGGAIRSAGQVDPRTFQIPESEIRACSCDSDCNRFAPNGPAFDPSVVPRPVCRFPNGPPSPGSGECWVQLEFDRVEIRPDGVEVILAEDETDPQLPLLPGFVRTFLCADERSHPDPANPVNSTLAFPFLVPVPPPAP